MYVAHPSSSKEGRTGDAGMTVAKATAVYIPKLWLPRVEFFSSSKENLQYLYSAYGAISVVWPIYVCQLMLEAIPEAPT